jgi:hypothetical protein
VEYKDHQLKPNINLRVFKKYKCGDGAKFPGCVFKINGKQCRVGVPNILLLHIALENEPTSPETDVCSTSVNYGRHEMAQGCGST